MPTSCDYELSKLNSLKKPEIIGRKSKKWCAEKEYGDFILVNLPSMKLHGNYFIILSFNLCSAQTFKMSFLKSLRSLLIQIWEACSWETLLSLRYKVKQGGILP
jgi:hypothetical protein